MILPGRYASAGEVGDNGDPSGEMMPLLVAERQARLAGFANLEQAIKAIPGSRIMAGDSSTNAPTGVTTAVFRANGAAHTSPGQRPRVCVPRSSSPEGAAQSDATGIAVAWMFRWIPEA